MSEGKDTRVTATSSKDDNKDIDTQDTSKKKKPKKISWRKQKKMHRLYWRVVHQKPKPFWLLFILELFIVIPLEILRRLLVLLRNLIVLVVIVGVIAGALVVFKFYPKYEEYNSYAERVVNSIDKSDFSINESSTIYSSDGSILAVVKEDADTTYLEYDDIPQYAIDAFVAIEDRTFWSNDGVDYKGIFRVCLNYALSKGDEVHGASTITQQLVKNIYLSSEVSLERKAKEILIARAITKQFSKREIMEFYVNDICYANGIYGLSGAAKAYFNKSVDKLTLSEIAYLCAIPNRPTYYDPYVYPEHALERRDKILNDMYECGFISHSQLLNALEEEIEITKPTQVFNNYETSFAVDSAIKYLMKLDGFEFQYEFETTDDYTEYHTNYNQEYEAMRHRLYTGGYKVYTSLDSNIYNQLQTILDEQLAFNSEVDEDTGIYKLQGAITCIDNETGKVVAVVGGRTQENDGVTYSFNRAYQSYRQPGSTFKPIAVYTPAMESKYGYTANTTVYNIDVSTAKEKGVDVQSLTGTAMTLRSAVENSKNGVAWQVFDRITPKFGMSYVTNMNFSNICPDDYYNSSALGGLTYGVTTVEMASAYSTLANHGEFREPTCLVSMLDRNGEEIFEEYETKQVYKKKAADDMVDILKGVLTRGTAAKLGWSKASKIEAFAKTGTTNNCKDGWLCGATPYYSIAVWIGFDTPKTLSNLYGATYPGQIWKASMLAVTEGLEKATFERADYTDDDKVEVEKTEGYYSYLEGRDDDELLSDGYTVANYREDRVIGESVTAIISQINSLDMTSANAQSTLSSLYTNGCSIINTIYSQKYTSEMQSQLDSAYSSKLNSTTPSEIQVEVVVPEENIQQE
jgi:membrane peptidoglycan carboxypeptidase